MVVASVRVGLAFCNFRYAMLVVEEDLWQARGSPSVMVVGRQGARESESAHTCERLASWEHTARHEAKKREPHGQWTAPPKGGLHVVCHRAEGSPG